MNKKNKIDLFDEVLRILFLEKNGSENDNISDIELFDEECEDLMKKESREHLIKLLYSKLNTLTFGELILNKVSENNLTMKELSQYSNLSESTIDELTKDRILTNNIPVLMLKNLLLYLKINFEEAKSSIYKSFTMIVSSKENALLEHDVIQPAFRRTGYKVEKDQSKIKETYIRDLFDNEYALNKYLLRLNELLNH